MNARTIDLDRPTTWPAPALGQVMEVIERTPSRCRHWDELPVSDSDEERFLDSFGEAAVRAYHCTKLLTHEVAAINRDGLGPLSSHLVDARIAAAVAQGDLTADAAELLTTSSVFASDDADGRVGQVCLLLSRLAFDQEVAGLWRLLGLWGGEAIYWANGDPGDPMFELLRSLGRPTIIVVDLEATPDVWLRHCRQGLLRLFTGRLLGLPRTIGEICVPHPVPPASVVDIWHPGHPEFDAHIELADD